jgi:hypothetical protein
MVVPGSQPSKTKGKRGGRKRANEPDAGPEEKHSECARRWREKRSDGEAEAERELRGSK